MPDGSWNKREIQCPFYKHDSYRDKSIVCEGVFDRSLCVHRFRRGEDRRKQIELFCSDGYKTCEIYRAIMEAKYPEE